MTPEEVISRRLPDMVSLVDPEILLPYLKCIAQARKETIQAEQRNQGKQIAVQSLVQYLKGRDKWFSQLCAALEHPDVGLASLAEKLKMDVNSPPGAALHDRHTVDRNTPVRELRAGLLKAFKRLDMRTLEDWKCFADKVGYTVDEMSQFEACPSPSQALFRNWVTKKDATLDRLVQVLHQLDRDDILTEMGKSEVGPVILRIRRRLGSDGDRTTRTATEEQQPAGHVTGGVVQKGSVPICRHAEPRQKKSPHQHPGRHVDSDGITRKKPTSAMNRKPRLNPGVPVRHRDSPVNVTGDVMTAHHRSGEKGKPDTAKQRRLLQELPTMATGGMVITGYPEISKTVEHISMEFRQLERASGHQDYSNPSGLTQFVPMDAVHVQPVDDPDDQGDSYKPALPLQAYPNTEFFRIKRQQIDRIDKKLQSLEREYPQCDPDRGVTCPGSDGCGVPGQSRYGHDTLQGQRTYASTGSLDASGKMESDKSFVDIRRGKTVCVTNSQCSNGDSCSSTADQKLPPEIKLPRLISDLVNVAEDDVKTSALGMTFSPNGNTGPWVAAEDTCRPVNTAQDVPPTLANAASSLTHRGLMLADTNIVSTTVDKYPEGCGLDAGTDIPYTILVRGNTSMMRPCGTPVDPDYTETDGTITCSPQGAVEEHGSPRNPKAANSEILNVRLRGQKRQDMGNMNHRSNFSSEIDQTLCENMIPQRNSAFNVALTGCVALAGFGLIKLLQHL